MFIAVEYGLRRVGVIRPVRDDKYRDVLRQAYDAASDSAATMLRDRAFFRGDGQHVSTRLLEKWLIVCARHNGYTCNVPRAGLRCSKNFDILPIDVTQKLLVLLSSACRYIALNQSWGNLSMPQPRIENLEDYCKPGSLDPEEAWNPKVNTGCDGLFLYSRFLVPLG